MPKTTVPAAAGYLLSAHANNSFIVVNDLLKAGVKVSRLTKGTADYPAGTFYIPAAGKAILQQSAVQPVGVSKKPKGMESISAMRIALWDNYGGSIPSGWLRWIMEQYHFPVEVIYPQDIDSGNLRKKYDAIIFVTRAIPPLSGVESNRYGWVEKPPVPEETPEKYRHMIGRISKDTSVPKLKEFLEAGGAIITIGTSTNLAYHLGVPVHNALVDSKTDKPLPGTKYFVPGSILQVAFDSTQTAAWGMPSVGDINFDNSPVFKLDATAAEKGVKPIAWFTTDKPLRSGWAWGQAYLKDGVAAFVAPVGKGTLYAFGPEITFRAQSHGTFKLLFNGLYTVK
jgi:hypothetical protein